MTPNMNLPNPVPGQDTGPDYAENIQSSLNIVDQHNHSAGQGVQIQPNGLNISSDLPFNSNNAVTLRSVRFTSQSVVLSGTSDVACLYVVGNELYYNDYTGGNNIQITLNGAINATSSGIASGTATAAFSAGVLVVKSSSTSFANIDMKSAILSNSGNLTNQLTLQAPTLSSSYDITLPTIPAQTNVMTLDVSGNMGSATYNAILAASSNANLGGKAVQESGSNLVVSNTNASASLSMVRGIILNTGGIFSGEGFSVTHPSTGSYIITYSTPLGDTGTVVASLNSVAGFIFVSGSDYTIGVSITVLDPSQNPMNASFNFIAIGQRT